jgi:hypothetical protein
MNYRSYRAAGVAALVTLLYCNLCPMAPIDRHALMCTFRDLISGSGHLLFDVVSRAAFAKKQATTLFAEQLMVGFWSAEPYFGLLRSFRYDDYIGLDCYTIFEPERSWEVDNWLQHFSPTDLETEFSAAGLRIVATFANVCRDPYDSTAEEFAVVA